MKPFYWTGTRNFGDYLNHWLWPKLIPDCLREDDGIRLVGIGSLLKSSLAMVEGTKVIFGTGSGYGALPTREISSTWKFYFVRGPLTASSFGLDQSKSIVDGAWLVGLLKGHDSPVTERSGVSFIPHWGSADTGVWDRVCKLAGFRYLDPRGDLESILRSIQGSELVVTESLHGAIFADLFRVPWVPVSLSPGFLVFKWIDWFRSVGVEGSVRQLPLSDLFEHFLLGVRPAAREYADLSCVEAAPLATDRRTKVRRAGAAYGKWSQFKRCGRTFRQRAFKAIKPVRSLPPMTWWDRKHQAELVSELRRLADGPRLLSSNAIWEEKRQRLAVVLERLRSDYKSGAIVSGPS